LTGEPLLNLLVEQEASSDLAGATPGGVGQGHQAAARAAQQE